MIYEKSMGKSLVVFASRAVPGPGQKRHCMVWRDRGGMVQSMGCSNLGCMMHVPPSVYRRCMKKSSIDIACTHVQGNNIVVAWSTGKRYRCCMHERSKVVIASMRKLYRRCMHILEQSCKLAVLFFWQCIDACTMDDLFMKHMTTFPFCIFA